VTRQPSLVVIARHIFCTTSHSFSTCADVVNVADEDGFFVGVVALVTFGNGTLDKASEPGKGRLGGKGEDEFRMLRGDGRGKVNEVV